MNVTESEPKTLLLHLLVGEVTQSDIGYFHDLGHTALQLTGKSIAVHERIRQRTPDELNYWPIYISAHKHALPLPHDGIANELTVSYDETSGKWLGSVGSFGVPDLYTRFENGVQSDLAPTNDIEAAAKSLFLHIQQLRQAG